MPIDIEIRISRLTQMVWSSVQNSLTNTCLQPMDGNYLDHADVKSVSFKADGNIGTFDVLADLFIVNQSSLALFPNATPPGALVRAAGADIKLALTVQGANLTLACTDITTDNPALAGVANAAKSTFPPQTAAFSGVFTSLGLDQPTSHAMLVVGDSLLIRFPTAEGGNAPFVQHIQASEDWSFFLDAQTMKDVARQKLDQPLTGLDGYVTGPSVGIQWAPRGSTPHVDVTVTGQIPVPDPFSLGMELDAGVDFLLQRPQQLQELVDWNVSFNGVQVPQFLIDAAQGTIKDIFDPTKFGGTPVSDTEFSFTETLPTIGFGPTTFAYAALTGLQDGMVLGGPITGIVDALTPIASVEEIQAFPKSFVLTVDCMEGFSGPVKADMVWTSATGILSGAGKFCAGAVVAPTSPDIRPFVSYSPAAGSVTGDVAVTVKLPGLIANAVHSQGQSVRILLAATRGVRLIDLGLPPKIVLDANGHVTNYVLNFISNCPGQPVPWTQEFGFYNPRWGVDPEASWLAHMEEVAVFGSTVLKVEGLEPGEILQFDQPLNGGRTAFAAGKSGRVVIPALFPLRASNAPATLTRLNRKALPPVSQSMALFERVATFNTPGAHSHSLTVDGGRATVVTAYHDRQEAVVIDAIGQVRKLGQHQVARLVPAAASRAGLADVGDHVNPVAGTVRALRAPGFEQEPISIARMEDGTHLLLLREEDGTVRVQGAIAEWPDLPAVSGDWAISASKGDRVAIYKVRRTKTADPCGCS